MTRKITPYLMFTGDAEEAIEFYVSLFDDAKIDRLERWGEDEPGPAGKIKQGFFTLAGRRFIAIDSPNVHEFSFTPSISFFLDCDSGEEATALFQKLSAGGKVLMPLDKYDFSEKFAWVEDRFGVSWQLNLAASQRAD